MKPRIFNMLFLWIVCLTTAEASPPDGLFNLKEGDWFEIKFTAPFDSKVTWPAKEMPAMNSDKDQSGVELHLRYFLRKQFADGRQSYEVTMERIVARSFYPSFGGILLGHDSYYPTYEENKKEPNKKVQFLMEVTPAGEIIRFDPVSADPLPEILLSEMSPKLKTKITISFRLQLSADFFKAYCHMVTFSPKSPGYKTMKKIDDSTAIAIETIDVAETESLKKAILKINDSVITEMSFSKHSGVPLQQERSFILTKASFEIPANTLISGKIPTLANQEVSITLKGHGSQAIFAEKRFSTNTDGSFNCPILLTRPLHLLIKVGRESLHTFMEPGDTLEISAIGKQLQLVDDAGELHEELYGHTPESIAQANQLSYFSGNAATNTMLASEMMQWMAFVPLPRDIERLTSYRKKVTGKIDQVFDKYEGKASKTCIDYFRNEWNYYLAVGKLYFFDSRQTFTVPNFKETVMQVTDLPPDFFTETDTLPVLMNRFEWGNYYQSFIYDAQQFKQQRLGTAAALSPGKSFYSDYFFSQASLKDYPLYRTLARALDKELRKGITAVEKVNPFYQDLINNCNDPEMVKPLQDIYETTFKLQPGRIFPQTSFSLADGSVFDLKRYKGKPICLIMLTGQQSVINYYKNLVEKFKNDEVQFVFANYPTIQYTKEAADSTLLSMPNVVYLALSETNIEEKLLINNTRIFVLDKWLKIVNDNAEAPFASGASTALEESLKKAIQAKRYSKEEKAAFFKTAGWSLGSILLTAFIAIIIYKARVKRLKHQEAVRRQIKELEIKAIRSQMNPHFIFNALNSIQSLINADQFKQANIYLSKFASLLRGVLNNSERGMVSLSDELQAVELYCQLEQLRFEFKLEMTIDPAVNTDLIEIPGMLIQPLAENAVIHGLSMKGEAGKLSIKISRDNGDLRIIVADNGVGLPSEEADTLRQKGFGLKLARERLSILSDNGKQARLNIESNADQGPGTTATLIIPID